MGLAAAAFGMVVGLTAIANPILFEQLCDVSNKWIRAPWQVSSWDQQVADPEQLARRYVRLAGMLILILATTLAIAMGKL